MANNCSNSTTLNASNFSLCEKPALQVPGPSDVRRVLLMFYSVLLIVTVLGNLLVCAAVCCDRRLRYPTNWFIVSLAMSDLLYACLSIPFRITPLASSQAISIYACRLWIWVDMVCAAASIANLALISLDRRLKIIHPFCYQTEMTGKRCFVAIGCVWTYAGVLASLSLVTWPGDKGIITSSIGSCFNYNRIFYTIAVVVGFLTPLVLLVLNYCLVYVAALDQFVKIKKVTLKSDFRNRRKKRNESIDFKATKTLAAVIGTFCTCWCPFFIIFTIMQYDSTLISHIRSPWNKIVFVTFVLVLPNLNAMCNPVIYAFFNSDFRRAFWRIVLVICKSKNAALYSSRNGSPSFRRFLSIARRRSGNLDQEGRKPYNRSVIAQAGVPLHSLHAKEKSIT